MRSKYRLIGIIVSISLFTSCSIDPFENSGRCDTPGKSSVFNSKLAVCTGPMSDTKWYHEGKFYDDTVLLAKTIATLYGSGIISEEVEAIFEQEGEDIAGLYGLYPDGLVDIDDLATYAGTDSRWDSLIEAKAESDSAGKTNSYLFQERNRLSSDYYRGKATRQQAYLAQQEHIEFLDGEYSKAEKNYRKKLEVLRAALSATYSINDKNLLLIFLLRHMDSLSK